MAAAPRLPKMSLECFMALILQGGVYLARGLEPIPHSRYWQLTVLTKYNSSYPGAFAVGDSAADSWSLKTAGNILKNRMYHKKSIGFAGRSSRGQPGLASGCLLSSGGAL